MLTFFHLGVAGTTLATLLWGSHPWQDPPSGPPLTFRMEGTVAFRPEDTPKNEVVVVGAGHEVQSTLDIPPAPPGGRLLVVLDAIPILGDDGLPWTTGPAPLELLHKHPWVIWN